MEEAQAFCTEQNKNPINLFGPKITPVSRKNRNRLFSWLLKAWPWKPLMLYSSSENEENLPGSCFPKTLFPSAWVFESLPPRERSGGEGVKLQWGKMKGQLLSMVKSAVLFV